MAGRYKTIVVDYEAMQACLDQHSEQGWKLKSVSVDSWRRVVNVRSAAAEQAVTSRDSGAPEEEIVASYYLLVFVRDDDPRPERGRAAAQMQEKGFSIPEF